MYIKKVIALLVSVALLASCIDLYTRTDDTDNDIHRSYSMHTFYSPASNSVYLIDPRPIFKNMIYQYDLSTQIWTAIASREHLPVSSHYDLLNVFSANLVNNDKIAILTKANHSWQAGKAYEFDLKEGKMNSYSLNWPVITNPDYTNPNISYTNISSIVQNQFTGKLYYIADTVLFALDDKYQFVKKCDIPLGNREMYHPGFGFMGEDTLITLISEYPPSDVYPFIDPETVTDKKLMIYKTNIHNGGRITYKHRFIDSLDVNYVNLQDFGDGKIITLEMEDYQPGKKDRIIAFREFNVLSNIYRNLPTFDNIIPPNTGYIAKWIDVTYSQFYSANCFTFQNSIYLFLNENGFVLYPNSNTWQSLPVPDFLKLNPKQQ